MAERIVVALGGNALGKTPEQQLELVRNTARPIVDLVEKGYEVIIGHGNGPQVGMINLAMEFSANKGGNTPFMPFPECGAMTQGYIGYHLQQAIQHELKNRGINKECATVVTQVVVDEKDPGFQHPTKPVGSFYTKEEAEKIAIEELTKVGLAERIDFMPSQLSGGQQQRVAIARSLVNEPEILLLDEPLGALDLKLRKEMQLELKRLQREMNITFVYVTHDQEEALTMSDTVVVMNKGNIQQIGSPQDIYNEPRNAFVAKFIGDSNIVDGIMEKDFLVSFGGQEFACVDRGFKPREPVQVVVRPEDVDIVPPSAGKLTGLVREVIFKGVHFEMHVDVEGKEWLIHSTQASQPGELIGMNIGPDEIHIMSREEV